MTEIDSSDLVSQSLKLFINISDGYFSALTLESTQTYMKSYFRLSLIFIFICNFFSFFIISFMKKKGVPNPC